jgi:hypothetical protein
MQSMPIANKTTNKMYELQSNNACCDEMLIITKYFRLNLEARRF